MQKLTSLVLKIFKSYTSLELTTKSLVGNFGKNWHQQVTSAVTSVPCTSVHTSRRRSVQLENAILYIHMHKRQCSDA